MGGAANGTSDSTRCRARPDRLAWSFTAKELLRARACTDAGDNAWHCADPYCVGNSFLHACGPASFTRASDRCVHDCDYAGDLYAARKGGIESRRVGKRRIWRHGIEFTFAAGPFVKKMNSTKIYVACDTSTSHADSANTRRVSLPKKILPNLNALFLREQVAANQTLALRR